MVERLSKEYVEQHINWYNKTHQTSFQLKVKDDGDLFPYIRPALNTIYYNRHVEFGLLLYNLCFFHSTKGKNALVTYILLLKLLNMNCYYGAEVLFIQLKKQVDNFLKIILKQYDLNTNLNLDVQFLFMLYHEFGHQSLKASEKLKQTCLKFAEDGLRDATKSMKWPITSSFVQSVIDDKRQLEEFGCDIMARNWLAKLFETNNVSEENSYSLQTISARSIFSLLHYKMISSSLRGISWFKSSYKTDALRVTSLFYHIWLNIDEEYELSEKETLNIYNKVLFKVVYMALIGAYKVSGYKELVINGASLNTEPERKILLLETLDKYEKEVFSSVGYY